MPTKDTNTTGEDAPTIKDHIDPENGVRSELNMTVDVRVSTDIAEFLARRAARPPQGGDHAVKGFEPLFCEPSTGSSSTGTENETYRVRLSLGVFPVGPSRRLTHRDAWVITT